MFKGLSAFPLTPFNDSSVDFAAFSLLIERLVTAKVDSIGVLGSTGSYAYLNRQERYSVARHAKELVQDIPMMVCIGAFSTNEILHLSDDAQKAGANGLLLPVLSYQPIRDDEVFEMFSKVSQSSSVPICVYDNPNTTHFTFTDELHGALSSINRVNSVKIPALPLEQSKANQRVDALRAKLKPGVTIGISGDHSAGIGLNAGCEVWYSTCAGLFPEIAKRITEASKNNDCAEVERLSTQLAPLWALFRQYNGSIRVLAAASGILGLTKRDCLPHPLQTLSKESLSEIAAVINKLGLR